MKLKNILVLAGGDSTRFWPLENKVLTEFLNRSLIEYIVDSVNKYTERIIIISHPNIYSTLKKLFKNSKKVYLIVQEEDHLGMASAIISAKSIIKDEEVLIINGSDFLIYDFLNDFILNFCKKNQLVILAKKFSSYFVGGYLRFDKKRRLIEIVEKPKKEKTPSNFVKLVVDYFSDFSLLTKEIINSKEKGDDLYEKVLTSLLKKLKVDVFYYQKDFYPLKYPWQVLSLMNYFLSKIKRSFYGKNIFISKKATVIGPVYFSNGVKVGDYAKVVGPTFIGENTLIADYALVNKSHIGNNCLIGGYSEVTRSYLGNKVFLHRNYVGDSVIDDAVLMGAFAVLANLRFDEKNVESLVSHKKMKTDFLKLGGLIGRLTKIGVSCTILPGIKIGKNTIIGPGQLVTKDVSDNKFLFKNKLKENFNL